MKWMKSLFSGLGMLPDEEVPNNFPLVLATRWRASETINKYLLLRGQLTVALQWGRHGQNSLQVGQKLLQHAQHSNSITALGAGERSMLTAQHSKISRLLRTMPSATQEHHVVPGFPTVVQSGFRQNIVQRWP